MKRLPITVLLLLGACAQTPMELRENQPSQHPAALPAGAAAARIERNFEELNSTFTAQQRPLDNGAVEVLGRVVNPLFLAQVSPAASGSTILLRLAQNWIGGGLMIPDLLKGC